VQAQEEAEEVSVGETGADPASMVKSKRDQDFYYVELPLVTLKKGRGIEREV
jgi:hypothetical protein